MNEFSEEKLGRSPFELIIFIPNPFAIKLNRFLRIHITDHALILEGTNIVIYDARLKVPCISACSSTCPTSTTFPDPSPKPERIDRWMWKNDDRTYWIPPAEVHPKLFVRDIAWSRPIQLCCPGIYCRRYFQLNTENSKSLNKKKQHRRLFGKFVNT